MERNRKRLSADNQISETLSTGLRFFINNALPEVYGFSPTAVGTVTKLYGVLLGAFNAWDCGEIIKVDLSLTNSYFTDPTQADIVNLIMLFADVHSLSYSGDEQLRKLEELPLSGLGNSLEALEISDCPNLSEVVGLERLTKLKSLTISLCVQLSEIRGLENLTQLTSLELNKLVKLVNLQGVEKLLNLTQLALPYCHRLTALDGLGNLVNLKYLNLAYCSNLTGLIGLENLTNLKELDLASCHGLTHLRVAAVAELETLNLNGCATLAEFTLPDEPTKLKFAYFGECRALVELKGVEKQANLEYLYLENCVSLQAIPQIYRSPAAHKVAVILTGCPQFNTPEVAHGLAAVKRARAEVEFSLEPKLSQLYKDAQIRAQNLLAAEVQEVTAVEVAEEAAYVALLRVLHEDGTLEESLSFEQSFFGAVSDQVTTRVPSAFQGNR